MASGGGFEVGEGIDTIDLFCGDQRSDAAPCSAFFIMASEEGVLSRYSERAD